MAVLAVMLMCVVAASAARPAPGRVLAEVPSIAPTPLSIGAPNSPPEGAPVESPVESPFEASPTLAPVREPVSAPESGGAPTPASAPAPVHGYVSSP